MGAIILGSRREFVEIVKLEFAGCPDDMLGQGIYTSRYSGF